MYTFVAENLNKVLNELPTEVDLIAVSKTKSNEYIEAAYAVGQRQFGENRPQELKAKAESLPKDIEWHMIGHLQRNKVKYIAAYVSLIHSVDKLSLLQEIDKRAKQHNRTINVLLQVHIAKEENKFGLGENEVIELIQSEAFQSLKNIQVVGLMGMATNTSSKDIIRTEFARLASFFKQIKECIIDSFIEPVHFQVISMGMSGDYKIAIEEGSNMVRIGSSIFGKRS